MKTRNTKPSSKEVTQSQFERAMQAYASAEAREHEITRSIEDGLNILMERYEPELHLLAHEKATAFETVQAYCTNNKETLFAKRRTIGTAHGIAGFRLGTPRLKPDGAAGWKKALSGLKTKLPAYVRTTEEPAKDLLLAHRNKMEVAATLVELGIRVTQDELFYIETRKAA